MTDPRGPIDPDELWEQSSNPGKRKFGTAANGAYRPPKLDAFVADRWQGVSIPERQWIAQPWIPRGAVTLLGGAGGEGKSLLSQMLLTSVALGRPWLGLDVAAVRCLGIFCEDDEGELQRRQADINRAYNADMADLDALHVFSAVGEDNALVAYGTTETGGRGLLEPTDFYRSIRAYIAEHGIQLVVLDSLHDLFPGNENSRPEVRRFVQYLIAMALDMDGAVILTAHPSLSGMSSGSGMSGSTAWNNAVRSRLYLSRPEAEGDAEPDDDARVLSRMKANYARKGDKIPLQWCDGVFVRPDADEFGFVAAVDRAAQRRRCQDVFLDLLARREAEGRPVSAKSRSSNYAAAEFAKHPHRQGYGKTDFERAMEALFSERRIEIVTYGNRPSRQFEKIVEKT
jgi:RecA-family ATPase